MKKRILLIPLALLLAMSLVAIGCPPQEPEEDVAPPVVPIRLGAVNPLGDITGEQATKAMELAVEEINAAGGVLGRPLELIVVDSEFNPAKGAAAIDKLAEVDKVDIFIGGLSSGVHLAQIPKLKKYEKVTVWMGAASHKREIELETALGETLTISPSKLIKHQGFTKQKILQWQGGEQQVIWPFEFATAEPIYPFPGWGER